MACTKGHRNNKTKKTRFIKKGDYIMDIIKSIEHEQMKNKMKRIKLAFNKMNINWRNAFE